MTRTERRTLTSATGKNRETATQAPNSIQGERPVWKTALKLTLLLRLTYSLSAAVAGLIQPLNWKLIRSNAFTENLPAPNHSLQYLFLGVWERFDTLWYLHIAASGYDQPQSMVFFPLYPALVRMMSRIMLPAAASLLISTVAAFFLFWGLQELLLADLPPKLARRGVLVCCVWPASFIFFAGYPESLLLALSVWSLSMARRGLWWLAVALGMASATTKAVGVVLFIPLLLIAIRQKETRKALAIALIPLSSVAFVFYVQIKTQATLASTYAQYWRTATLAPWTTLGRSLRAVLYQPNPVLVLNLLFLFFVVFLVMRSRLRMEYVAYSAAAIAFFLCKGTNPPLQSMVRYLLIVFPAYLGFARIFERPSMQSRFGMACAALFAINLGLLWLFLGWSLVL